MSLENVTSGAAAVWSPALPRGAATPAVAAKVSDHPIVTAAESRRCDAIANS